MSTSRLEYLFKRHVEKTATPEEKSELLAFIQDESNNTELNHLVDQALNENYPGYELPDETAASILASIIQVDQPGNKETQPIPVIQSRRPVLLRRWRYAAAAVLIALLAGTAWMILKPAGRKDHEMAAVNKVNIDIPPGKDKATLTLTDGTVIMLDSGGNKVIDQGGIAVRQHNGELQYKGSGSSGAIIYNILTTPKGGQFRITLPDSTRVWLNAASSLKYPVVFTGNDRKVELTGEGYFEVAKNKSKPFHVKVGDMEVKVLGTHFNIMAYTDEDAIKTTLTEGSVEINNPALAGRVRQPAMLKPGQQAVFTAGSRLTIHDSADIEEVLAWKNGIFLFKGADLPVLLRQFARWYDIEVKYKGQKRTYEFTGRVPRTAHLSSVLKLLEVNDIEYTLQNKQLIIQP